MKIISRIWGGGGKIDSNIKYQHMYRYVIEIRSMYQIITRVIQ